MHRRAVYDSSDRSYCGFVLMDKQSGIESVVREGVESYREGKYIVFTAAYHLKRGYCCDSACRHCPYRSTTEATDRSIAPTDDPASADR